MKTLLIGCFMLTAACAYAQFEAGTMMVGGNVGFSSITEKSKNGSNTTTWGKTTYFNVLPQFGYFVIDNVAVGAGLTISSEKFKADDEIYESSEYTSTSTQLTPFVRYYMKNFFAQGTFGFGSTKYKPYDGSETKKSVSSWGIGIGYAHLLNESVAVEPSITYGSRTEKDKDTDNKDIHSGLMFNIGFQIYLHH